MLPALVRGKRYRAKAGGLREFTSIASHRKGDGDLELIGVKQRQSLLVLGLGHHVDVAALEMNVVAAVLEIEEQLARLPGRLSGKVQGLGYGISSGRKTAG